MCDGFYDFFENRVQIIKFSFSILFLSVDDYLFKECVFLLLFILIFFGTLWISSFRHRFLVFVLGIFVCFVQIHNGDKWKSHFHVNRLPKLHDNCHDGRLYIMCKPLNDSLLFDDDDVDFCMVTPYGVDNDEHENDNIRAFGYISIVYRNARCSIRHRCGWSGRSIGLQYIEFEHTTDNSWFNETFNLVIVFTWIDGRFENDPGKCKYNWMGHKHTIHVNCEMCALELNQPKCAPLTHSNTHSTCTWIRT